MTSMSILISVIIPSILILGVFLLRPLRTQLEAARKRAAMRSELIDEYHDNAMVFLKSTNPDSHKEARDLVVSLGEMMMDGTKLVRSVLFFAKRQTGADDEASPEIVAQMADLSDDARHALGKALGAALLISSFQSHFFGRAYRSILLLVLRENDREIKEPEQIVYRFGKSKRLWNGANTPTC